MSTLSKNYLPQVDALRAISVLVVVLYHSAPRYVPGGYIGVDIFFVISGFVIARGYQNEILEGTVSPLRFFRKRVRRLFPALAFLVLCCAIYATIFLKPAALIDFGWSISAVALFVQNVYFWSIGDYFSGPLNKPLLHLWSLAVEEQFYFLWPLAMLALSRLRWVAIVLFAVLLASFLLSFVLEVRSPKTVFYWLPFRIWQFGLGIVAFNLTRVPAMQRWVISDTIILPICLLAIGFFSCLGGSWTDFPGFGNTVLCLIAAYSLMSADLSRNAVPPVARNRSVLFTGRISYSWYLWHWPPLSFLFLQLGREAILIEGLLIATLSFLAAWGSFVWVEDPIRRRAFKSVSVMKAWALVSCVFFAFGFLINSQKGLVQRFPSQLQSLYLAKLEGDTSRCSYLQVLSEPGSEFCSIHRESPERPTVLFLGDSHVAVIKETLRDFGARLGVNVLMTTRNCDLGRYGTYSFCSDAVLEKLVFQASEASVDAIVAMSFWESERFSASDMATELDKLGKVSPEVFVVETVPHSERFHPQVRIDEYNETGRVDWRGIEKSTFDENIKPVFEKLLSATEKASIDAQLLFPRDYVCSDVECPFILNGEVLYFDSNHVTYAGGRLLRQMFEETFEYLRQN